MAKGQAGNPFTEGEKPDIKAPNRFPQVKPRAPDGTADLREPVDQEAAAPVDERLAKARRAFAAAKAANAFFGQEVESPISRVPDDDPNWAYKWMRDMLPASFLEPAGIDTKNIAAHEHGRLSWEVVTPDMLSPKWQQFFLSMARRRPGFEGANAGTCYRYQDVVLVRTLAEARDMQVAAFDEAAKIQRMAVNAQAKSESHRRGVPMNIDEQDRQGFVDFFE